MSNTTIVVANGDGIGPEIMGAVLRILEKSGAKLNIKHIDIGEKLYLNGISTGISQDAWDAIKEHKILLKAPITTPQGKGYKSLNVTFRKTLGLFANVRPVLSFQPFIPGPSQKMDMVVVRENEEDLYAGVEYRSTESSYSSLKLISRAGSEKIIRYAFEYARINKRSKVTCVIKDNIMKITDGLFHNMFKEIAKEYPEIAADNYLVDIGAARIATRPQAFDVVVTMNLYGDIISDIAAEVSGSVGLAGSSNIGTKYAMFEAIHGSAPDIAGKNIANPSGLLNAAILMLNHIGQQDAGAKIQNAWLKTIEEGMHTVDIYSDKSKKKLSTTEFADAVIANLGHVPQQFKPAVAKSSERIQVKVSPEPNIKKELVGVDIYLMDHNKSVNDVSNIFKNNNTNLELKSIAQRGLLIWPSSEVEDITNSMMRLRFAFKDKAKIKTSDMIDIMNFITANGFEISMTYSLYNYEGVEGFTRAQGE